MVMAVVVVVVVKLVAMLVVVAVLLLLCASFCSIRAAGYARHRRIRPACNFEIYYCIMYMATQLVVQYARMT